MRTCNAVVYCLRGLLVLVFAQNLIRRDLVHQEKHSAHNLVRFIAKVMTDKYRRLRAFPFIISISEKSPAERS